MSVVPFNSTWPHGDNGVDFCGIAREVLHDPDGQLSSFSAVVPT
jgi:hypothetical protein